MKLTKAQVIALFLATSKASDIVVEVDEIINAGCSTEHVAAGTPESSLTVCSSLTTCTNDADCTGTANEKCGSFVQDGQETQNKCVYQRACNNVGRLNNIAFSLQCWNGEVPDPLPNPLTYFDNVATIVGQDGIQSFTDVKHVKIPSIDNFQTGWWRRVDNTSSPGIYYETDKPVNNKCQSNSACGVDECCANWPDSNNKRCIAKSLGGVEQNLLPLEAFTPICAANINAAPISAKQDLSQEAAAQAAQAIVNFHDLVEVTAKTDAKYDEMTEEEKEAFDEKRAALKVESEAFDFSEKQAAGYEFFDNDQKSVYDALLLKWKQHKYEICEANSRSIECRKANEIRIAQEAARLKNQYYVKTTVDREALDQAQWESDRQMVAGLTAAWIDENKPAQGFSGSACSAAEKCAGLDMCCGTATPSSNAPGVTTGQRIGVCASKTSKGFTDTLGIEFSHVCGAQKLVAAAAAILATTYLM